MAARPPADPVTDRLAGRPVVEARRVGKVYRLEAVEVRALVDADLTVRQGDSVAIMGPSGSGKSTLLGLLGGLDRPTEGTLLFDGADVAALSDDQLATVRNRVIGFVFQNFQLLARTPAIANVGLPLVYRGVGRAERRRRATAALEAVGLGHRLDHRPSQLSGGEQQRVAIARALVTDPGMLLADEPTGNLDSRSGEEVLRILTSLHDDRGVAVVVVTHDPGVAARFGRTVTVRDGHVTENSFLINNLIKNEFSPPAREGASEGPPGGTAPAAREGALDGSPERPARPPDVGVDGLLHRPPQEAAGEAPREGRQP